MDGGGIELGVGGFDAEEEAVVGRAVEVGCVENGVVQSGKAVEVEHPEGGGEGGEEDGEFEGNRDPCGPGVVGAAADVDRVVDDVGVPAHAEAGETAEEAGDAGHGGDRGGVEVEGVGEAVDREGV